MDTALEILEDEETHLLNTVETVMEVVEEEETHSVNSVETVLQIKEDEETGHLVNTLKTTLQTLPPMPTECCIYRVPCILRRVNEEAYTPTIVSIGPFHHGIESLQKMEVQKHRYLNHFLKRRPDLDLEYHVRKMKKFEKRARNCYAENIDLSSNDFITMMLLDGCFIVEFLIKHWYYGQSNKDDPIFKSDLMIIGIIRDMLMLENQLPFFILAHLFNFIVEVEPLRVIALSIMENFLGGSAGMDNHDRTTDNTKHLVDLCLRYHTPTGTEVSPKTRGGLRRIPNATRLHESGVKFRKPTGISVKCFLDAKFTNGNMEIPCVKISDSTETFLRNLIAFEQCDSGNTQIFSDYTSLMDCLIDTPNDVELLKKAGIISNLLGDNEAVSQLFNKLGSGVIFGCEFYFDQLFEDVNNYCSRPWHAWRAKLTRDYFNTPWTIISVVAAAILLILAFIQSVCSILQSKG